MPYLCRVAKRIRRSKWIAHATYWSTPEFQRCIGVKRYLLLHFSAIGLERGHSAETFLHTYSNNREEANDGEPESV